jgi:hypothetical protein
MCLEILSSARGCLYVTPTNVCVDNPNRHIVLNNNMLFGNSFYSQKQILVISFTKIR